MSLLINIRKQTGLWSQNRIGLYLMALLIPFNPKWYGIGIAFFLLETLLFFRKSTFALNVKPVHIFMSLFFLSHIIGMSYSENSAFGWSDIGMKVSFVLFPLIFAFTSQVFTLRRFITFYLTGALLAISISLIIATINYFQRGEYAAYFFDSRLSFFMHRSYWATYLVIAYAFVWYLLLNDLKKSIYWIPLLFVFFSITLMTGSKMGIILLLITTLVMTVYFVMKFRLYLSGVLIFLVFAISAFAVTKVAPQLTSRIQASVNSIFEPKQIDVTSTESNAARILMWETSSELIKENLIWGVGTGDIKDELKNRNIKKGYLGIAEMNLNAHNQFLNTQLALGLLGTLSLLGMFIFSFIGVPKSYRFIGRIAIIVLFLSLLTESFLETQAGIIPVAFLLCLFNVHNSEKN